MNKNEQQQPDPAQAPAPSPYIARKPLRFGSQTIQPGQPVPVEDLRNYGAMLQRGEITFALHPGADYSGPKNADYRAHPAQSLTPSDQSDKRALALTRGPAYFVSEDGAASAVMILGFMTAGPEDAENLGVTLGSEVAEVTFTDDPSGSTPSIVPLGSLLPQQPTERMVQDLEDTLSRFPAEDLDPQAQAARYGLGVGEAVYVVSEGEPLAEGTVLSVSQVTEEDFDYIAAGFNAGDHMVTVQIAGGELAYVPLSEVLPGDLADRLLEHLESGQPSAPAGAEGAAAADSGELEATRAALASMTAERDLARLYMRAALAEGEELPENVPARTALMKTDIQTLEGLTIYASGEGGLQRLIDLDGIAEKSAVKIMAYMQSGGHLNAQAEAQPHAD